MHLKVEIWDYFKFGVLILFLKYKLIFIILLAYLPSKLMGINFFVLNSNEFYCSIMFENCIESTTFVKFIYKVH